MSYNPDLYRNRESNTQNKFRECCEKPEKVGLNKYGTDELKSYMRKQKELRRVRALQDFEERERELESKKQRLRELDSKCKQIAYKKLEKKPSVTSSPLSPNSYCRVPSHYVTSTSNYPQPTTSRSEKSSRSRPQYQPKRTKYEIEEQNMKPSRSSTKLEREAANFIFKEFENIVKRECKNLLKSRHHQHQLPLSGSTSATSVISLSRAPTTKEAVEVPSRTKVIKVDKNVGTSFTIYDALPLPCELPSRIIDSDSQHSDLSSSVIKPIASSRGCHSLIRKRRPYEIPAPKHTTPENVKHAAAARIQAAYKSYRVRSILSEAKLLPRVSSSGVGVNASSRPTTTTSTVSSQNAFPSADSLFPRKKTTFYKPQAGSGIGTAEKPYDSSSYVIPNKCVTYTSTKKKIPNPVLLGFKASPIRPNPEDIPGYIPPPPSYKPMPRAPDMSPRTLPLLRLKTVDEPFPNKQLLENFDNSQHSLSSTSSPLKLISSISKFQLPSSLVQSGSHQQQNSREVASNLIRAALRQTVGKVANAKESGFENMEPSQIYSAGRALFTGGTEQAAKSDANSRIAEEKRTAGANGEARHQSFQDKMNQNLEKIKSHEDSRKYFENRTRYEDENKFRNLQQDTRRNFEEGKQRAENQIRYYNQHKSLKEEKRNKVVEENRNGHFQEHQSRNDESRNSEKTRLRHLREGIRILEGGLISSGAKIQSAKKPETREKAPPSTMSNGNAHPTPFVDLPVPAFSTVLQEKLRLLREEQIQNDIMRTKSKSPTKRSLTAVSKATEQIKKKIIEAKQILEEYKMELLRSSSASNLSHGDDHDPTYESDFDSESILSQSQQQNSLFGHDSEILSSLGVDLEKHLELIPRPGAKGSEEREKKSGRSSGRSSSIPQSKEMSLESYREPSGRVKKHSVVSADKINVDATKASEILQKENININRRASISSEAVIEEGSDDTEYEEIVETVSRASSNLPTEDVVHETDFDTNLQSSISKQHRSSVGVSQKDLSLVEDMDDKDGTEGSISISTGTDPAEVKKESKLPRPISDTTSSKLEQGSQAQAEKVFKDLDHLEKLSVSAKLLKKLEKSFDNSKLQQSSGSWANSVATTQTNEKSSQQTKILRQPSEGLENRPKSLEKSESPQKSADSSEYFQKSVTHSEDPKTSSLPEAIQKSPVLSSNFSITEGPEESLAISEKSMEVSEELPMSNLSISEPKVSLKTDDVVSENLPKSVEESFLKSISEKLAKSGLSELLPQSIQISMNLPGTTSERSNIIEEEKLETNFSISGISLASNIMTDAGSDDFETDVESQSLMASKKEDKIPSSSIAVEEPTSANEQKEFSTIHTIEEQLSKQSKVEDSVQPSFLSEQEETQNEINEDISGKIVEEFSSMSEASNLVDELLETESNKPEILLEKPAEFAPSEISSDKPDRASPPSPVKLDQASQAHTSEIVGISEELPPSKSPEDLDSKIVTEPDETSHTSPEASLLILSQHSQTEEPKKLSEPIQTQFVQKEVSTQSDSFLTEISQTVEKQDNSINDKEIRDNFSQSEISINLPSSDSEVQTSENICSPKSQKASGDGEVLVPQSVQKDEEPKTMDAGSQIQQHPASTPEKMSEEASEAELLETLAKTVDPDIIDKIESLIASEISKQIDHEDSSESSQATAVEDSRYSSYVSNFHVEDVVYESDFDTDVQSDRSESKSKSKHSSLLETAVKKEVEIMVQNGDLLKKEVKTGEGDFVSSRPATPEDPRIRHVLDDKLVLESLVSRIISRMLQEVSKARQEAFKEPANVKGQSIIAEMAESEGSSVHGEVDVDAEWFEDDLLSASASAAAAADDESLKREAAEIVAEQLRIENEIRALEALQAQVPATLLNLSDIPDKPPPPYSPPSSDSVSFSVRSFTVQTSLKNLQDLINTRVDQVWPQYTQTGNIPPLEETSSMEKSMIAQKELSGDNPLVPSIISDTDPSMTSTRAFNILLHNLIQDTIKEILLIEDTGPTARDYIDKIRPGSLALEAQRMRVPRTKESLSSVVYSKVKNLLPFTVLANHPPAPRKRLTKWTSRPRDLVDEVLAEELIDEDREWTESWPEEILVLDRWAEKFARKALGEVVFAFKTAFT